MKRLVKRMSAIFMAAVLLITTAIPAMAASAPPTELKGCTSNFGYDFKITFSSADSGWLSAITGVTVGETTYTKCNSSYSVWNNTSYYVDAGNNYLLIGEKFDGNTAECVITAEGYSDLKLALDKTNHSAAIQAGSGGDPEPTHTGGSATCQQRAVCEGCGEEYGDLGEHQFVNGVCTVCGFDKSDTPTVTADNSESTYFILKVSGSGYVGGISSISCNGETLEETSFKLGLNGTKYYLDKENNAIYFDKLSGIPFQSGDIITIEHPDYKDLQLKLTIAAGAVTVAPAGQEEQPGDDYSLFVRLIGYFESALVGQTGYDAISGATIGVTENKNSNAQVEAALVPKDEEPADADWAPLHESGITIDRSSTTINLDAASGMKGVYSTYDSSLTLSGTPAQAGEYPISVTLTDDQGRTATSNQLIFKVYSGQEYLADQLILANCTQTADGKYMYDMEPWAITKFNGTDSVVTVPADVKAWYGSHTSGTYGELGYAVPEGDSTTQTLVVPEGCNLTLVNMDILSSVRIVVQDGGTLILRDSVVQGVVEVQSGGTFSMNYDDYSGEFLSGASINGQLILKDGATLKNSSIYSNTNNIANGTQARHNTQPVVAVEGNVTVDGQVFIRGDEAPTGTDPSTGKSYSGQAGLSVANGTLTLTEGSVLAVYGGGHLATTSNGGAAVILDQGTITGAGQLIAVGGSGTFGSGGSAVEGSGTISTSSVYLEGGSTFKPGTEDAAGQALANGVSLSGDTNRKLVDGTAANNESEMPDGNTYWSSVTELPDLTLYAVEQNAPGGQTPATPGSSSSGSSSSGGGSYSGAVTYPVSVPSSVKHGSISVSAKNASKGTTVTVTVQPEDGYQLDTLSVTDKDGQALKLTNKGNGKYSFTMPASKVSVQASFVLAEALDSGLPFADVNSGDWFYDAVQYVYDNGLMSGTSNTSFHPNTTTTRGMIVTILYQLAGTPTTAASQFIDVADGQYYSRAVAWASANGIVSGYGDGRFGPDDAITREQLAVILYHYASYAGCDVSGRANLSGYADDDKISSYAAEAFQWANAQGLMNGISAAVLSPAGPATRAQAACVMAHLCTEVVK